MLYVMDIIRGILIIYVGIKGFQYIADIGESPYFIPIDKIFIILLMIGLWNTIYLITQLLYNGLDD